MNAPGEKAEIPKDCVGGGFDCDDYADAAKFYFENAKPNGILDSSVTIDVYRGVAEQYNLEFEKDDQGRAVRQSDGRIQPPTPIHYPNDPANHAFLIFTVGSDIGQRFISYDPQRQFVSQPRFSPAMAAQDLLLEGYTHATPENANVREVAPLIRQPINDINGPPFHTVPSVVQKFTDALNRAGVSDPTPYLPPQ